MVNQRWFKTALAVEMPILIVTVSLLSWALYALNDAHTFVDLSSQGPFASGGDRARYGLDLGTQIATVTITYTGATAIYSPVISYTAVTRQVLSDNSSTTAYIRNTRQSFLGSTSGTITTTATQTMYPGVFGTAGYGDIYSLAQVSASTLKMWAPGEYERSHALDYSLAPSTVNPPPTSAPQSSATSTVPVAAATQAPERRDGSWSEGYTYNAQEEGLYYPSWENLFELGLWLGTFAACVVVLVARLLVNVAYIWMVPRKATAILLLSSAAIALAVLLGCGIAAWVYFITWQHLTAPEVQATFAFYIISTAATLSVLILAAAEAHRYNAEAKPHRQDSIDHEDIDGASTAVGHQTPIGGEK
ncbi:hypothetical protein BCV69DRAFT_285155 [Microstroma glucosiphilum]|uniref:Uncharacterized protein n=1 Tax=Pseudomicrostroma glucosiphilum TaxID=1684307 RepID=A0A316U279_9BASI|nr:hypothetical protein BCV69DRAFT_285155 [Pseudomicrostroma glucosiphilum]PWN18533.1 hypothetical protein BCV69DRAFT_285155 [Pseudomicrostroma glucosiphilum]